MNNYVWYDHYLHDPRPSRAELRRARWTKFLVVVTIAIWTYAGYATGLAKGKGWRDTVGALGCQVVCPAVKETRL